MYYDISNSHVVIYNYSLLIEPINDDVKFKFKIKEVNCRMNVKHMIGFLFCRCELYRIDYTINQQWSRSHFLGFKSTDLI